MKLTASVAITLNILVLLLALPVFLLEKVNHKSDRSRNAKRTKRLLYGVLISNVTYHLWWIILLFICTQCAALRTGAYATRSLLKGINLMFLLHRAKLAQGLRPIFSTKWFEKVFPCTIVGYTVMLIGGTIYGVGVYRYESYPDTNALQTCTPVRDDEDDNFEGIGLLAIGWDLLITAAMLTLFVVPLYRVYKTDLGVLNTNQLKQRLKLKKLLLWSIVMTFINQVTSALAVAAMIYQYNSESKAIYVVWAIGQFDPAFNIWTSWLMITRNRAFVQRSLFCRSAEERLLRANSVLTDIGSRTNSGRLHRMKSRDTGISEHSEIGSRPREMSEITLEPNVSTIE